MPSEPDHLRVHGDFLRRYLAVAPAALAIERSEECALLAELPFQRPVLDIGCGDGVFAHVLFADAIDTGIDYDAAEIERARPFDGYKELIVCGGDRIPKPDASYNTIFSNSVLEHIPDLIPVLREQARLLAEGGRFYITVPTDQWERATVVVRLLRALGAENAALAAARSYNRFWRHHHAHAIPDWERMFAEAGLRVVSQHVYAPRNLTTFLDLISPLAAPAMASKKLLKRWIALPALRGALTPLYLALSRLALGVVNRGAGSGLVRFVLTRA